MGRKKSPYEAMNYRKLILSLTKTQLIERYYTDLLSKKAGRFIDKDSMRREKLKIK